MLTGVLMFHFNHIADYYREIADNIIDESHVYRLSELSYKALSSPAKATWEVFDRMKIDALRSSLRVKHRPNTRTQR